MSTPKLQVLGKFGWTKRLNVDCENVAYTLAIENNAIYNIVNCSILTIEVPSEGDYAAHLFVRFADSGDVGFTFPEGIPIYGSSPDLVTNGDVWEVNIDSAGGIVCLRQRQCNV